MEFYLLIKMKKILFIIKLFMLEILKMILNSEEDIYFLRMEVFLKVILMIILIMKKKVLSI